VGRGAARGASSRERRRESCAIDSIRRGALRGWERGNSRAHYRSPPCPSLLVHHYRRPLPFLLDPSSKPPLNLLSISFFQWRLCLLVCFFSFVFFWFRLFSSFSVLSLLVYGLLPKRPVVSVCFVIDLVALAAAQQVVVGGRTDGRKDGSASSSSSNGYLLQRSSLFCPCFVF